MAQITIDGVVFLKQRTCPLVGLRNTAENVIRTGMWGHTYSQYALWQRGTAQNPQARYSMVAVLT